MTDATAVSLFAHLRSQFADDRSVFRVSKQTLVDFSHSLEDRVLEDQLPSLIFTGFQHNRYWQQELERYRQLSTSTHQLYVFAAEASPIPEERQAIITLDAADPLCQEWFVVVLNEQFSALLCSREIESAAVDENERVFETICSFDPNLLDRSADFLFEVVKRYRPDQSAALIEARRAFKAAQPSGSVMSKLMATLMHYTQQRQDFLRDTLLEQRRLQEAQSALERTLVELAVPVIPLVPGVIVMPLVGSVDARRSQQVMEALLEGIASKQADVAILDITGVPLIDTNVANNLLQSVRAANMLGAQVILTGIGADIAQTLVHLDVDFSRMQTQANLQDGIQAALALQQLHIAPLKTAPDARKAGETTLLKNTGFA